MRILGFMTGTSLDAVDMAVLETDGEAILAFGPAGERKLSAGTRAVVEQATAAALAWPWDAPKPEVSRRRRGPWPTSTLSPRGTSWPSTV